MIDIQSLSQTIFEMTQFFFQRGKYDPLWLISRLNTAFSNFIFMILFTGQLLASISGTSREFFTSYSSCTSCKKLFWEN